MLCLIMLFPLFFIGAVSLSLSLHLRVYLPLFLRHRNKIYIFVCISEMHTRIRYWCRGLESVNVDLWCLQLIWIDTGFFLPEYFLCLFINPLSLLFISLRVCIIHAALATPFLWLSLSLARFHSCEPIHGALVNCLRSNSENGFKLFTAT